MHRRTFDTLMSLAGLILAVVLLAAGSLMLWANSFVSDQVADQLSAQKIFFPPKGDPEYKEDARVGTLEKWAGEQLLTGEQARGYAENFIGAHLDNMTGGKTYSELSGENNAKRAELNQKREAGEDVTELEAEVAAMSGLVDTVFKGETLKGLLLNAYAFGQMGAIALWGAIASFIGAVLMLILSLLGFRNASKVPADATVMVGKD